jgi:hypothetical protein
MEMNRGIRRKIDYQHVLKKKRKDRIMVGYGFVPAYDNVHQYSKNKIHCSCDMCNRRKSSVAAGDNCVKHYSFTDQKKIMAQCDQIDEFDAEKFEP